MPTAGTAFTLIELLVVIAVIAVLAALLLPALARARDAGKRVACVSNLRQLSLACHAYAGDYDGWLPAGVSARGSYVPNTPYRSTQWYPYDLNYPLGPMILSYAGNNPRLLFCPGNRMTTDSAAKLWWQDCCIYDPSYLYYAYLGPDAMINTGLFPYSPRKLTDSPNDLLWGDVDRVYQGQTAILVFPSDYLWGNHLNHDGDLVGANWAMLDGSVIWFPKSQLQLNNAGVNPGTEQYYLPAYVFQ